MRRLSLVLALAVLAAVACTSDPPPSPEVPAAGIVSLPLLLGRPDVTDVDFGTEGPGYRLSYSMWEGELVLVGGERPAHERFVVTVQAGGPSLPLAPPGLPMLHVSGHEAQIGPGPPVGCAGRSLLVQATPTARLVVTGVTDHPAEQLATVAETMRLVGNHIETEGDVRRLPGDWLLHGGSRLSVGAARYLVRRVDRDEQELLLALRCPRGDQISPPDSVSPRALRGLGAAQLDVDGRRIDVGVTGQALLAVVRGRRGILVATPLDCCHVRFRDLEAFARLATQAGVVDRQVLQQRDETVRQAVTARRLAQLAKDFPNEAALEIAHGDDGDLGWVLARRVQRWLSGRVEPEVCHSSLSQLDGGEGYGFQDECIQEAAVGPPLVPAPTSTGAVVDHLWGAVGDRVATVVVERPGWAPRRISPTATSDPTMRRIFFVAFDPPMTTAGFTVGDLLRRTTDLGAGPVVLRALDATGRQLAAVAVGKAGCPVPPGCPA